MFSYSLGDAIHFARLAITIARTFPEPIEPSGTRNSWKPLLNSMERNFLGILDIPFSPREPARHVLITTDVPNVDDTLGSLPAQEMHTIRVYFAENLSIHGERIDISTPSFAGSPAMISQWGLSSKKRRWETHSYRLPLAQTLSGERRYTDSISIAAGTIRRTLSCMIVSKEDGRISCE